MNKITFAELERIMREYNRTHKEEQEKPKISGVIVYKASSWEKPYTEEQRSYRVWNNNRAWQDGKIANSIFACCLDGTDLGVRLDWYFGEWEVDYCYMEEANTDD